MSLTVGLTLSCNLSVGTSVTVDTKPLRPSSNVVSLIVGFTESCNLSVSPLNTELILPS